MSFEYSVFDEVKGDQYIITVREDGARREHVFNDKAEAEKFRQQQSERLAAIAKQRASEQP